MSALRVAGVVAALSLLFTGCKREVLTDVPTLGARPCTVRLGDPRSNVLLRCGAPCGGGEVAPDLRCDVYLSAEVCYRDGQVVTLGRLAPFNGRFPWCEWNTPVPAAAEEPAQESEAAPGAGRATSTPEAPGETPDAARVHAADAASPD